MWGLLRGILGSLVGPAIVATLVSYYLTTRDERRRTVRDRVTASFDETRKDIREAVFAGVAYFGCTDGRKLPDLEAQVLLYESDVRSGMAAIREMCTDAELLYVPNLLELEGEFLDALTGGRFGSTRRSADRQQSRRIIGLGTRLRSDISRLRRHQLSRAMPGLVRPMGLMILVLVAALITYAAGVFAGIVIGTPHTGLAKRAPQMSSQRPSPPAQ